MRALWGFLLLLGMAALLVPDTVAESPKKKQKHKTKYHPPVSKAGTILPPVPPPPGFYFTYYEISPASDLQVRTLQAPTRTDEKGNTQKFTPEELKKFKGSDPDLPGYPANFTDLLTGQIVKVYLRKSTDEKAEPSSTGNMLSGRLAGTEETTKKVIVRVQYPLGKDKAETNGEKEVVMDKLAALIVIVDPVPGEVATAPRK